MHSKSILSAVVGLCLVLGVAVAAMAQATGYRVSAPYSYKNLSIFLIHGKDESNKGNILTLQEAMERKLFVVYETSNVNELEVENLSKEFEVFIQSGDIVKGGKQDRILAVSIIIPARSGRVSIQSFCVESGRWTKRGDEDSGKFTSSNDRVVTKELKIAANAARSQQEVWSQVSEAQSRLSKNLGGSVASGTSSSSLQLSLENKKVVANVDEYISRLGNVINGQTDVIGYAFAVNGQINSADIYVSNALFKKLWSKMLKAAATEAVSQANGVRLADPVKADAVKGFIVDSEKAKAKEQSVGSGAKLVTREDKDNVMFEARDEKSKAIVHRSYVKKQ
jgi:ARG/rhodanese/phosphatase superfamily protein